MKKSVVLLASVILSGCACFSGSENPEQYNDNTPVYEADRYREPAYMPRRATIVKRNYEPAVVPARRPDEFRTYRTTYDTVYEVESPENIRYYRVTNQQAPQPVMEVAVPAPQPVTPPVVFNAPAPVIYTAADVYTAPAAVPCNSCNTPATSPAPAPQTTTTAPVTEGGNPCPEKVTENRVPVEVVYKKTVTRTVYEPKTYENVSYEKEPYTPGSI